MSFFLFLTLVLLLVLLRPIFKIWLQIRRVRNAYRDMARQQQDAYERTPRSRKGKSKIFSPNEGEYVEFTEIEVSETTESADAFTNPASPACDEEQISDAEWEEIK